MSKIFTVSHSILDPDNEQSSGITIVIGSPFAFWIASLICSANAPA